MNRKSALAAAAVTAVLGASGVVAVMAVTGAHVLGLHFGAARPALADASPTSADTTEVTEPVTEAPTTVAPTVPTTALDPIYVVQTESYDEYVVVPSGGSSVADTPPPPAPAVQAPAAPVTQATPATQAPAPAVTEATVPASTETQPTEATTTTTRTPTPPDLVDAAQATCGSGCAINVPNEAKGFFVPKPAPPSGGGTWKECEFHVGSPPTTTATNRALPGVWECQK
jgi:hypothetical protein